MKKDNRSRAQHKKALHKLVVARSDFDTVKMTGKALIATSIEKQYQLRMALQTSLVVTYSRPFTQSDIVGRLGSEWEKFPIPRLKEVHDKILSARNEWVAHSDPHQRQVRIIMPGVQLPAPMGYQKAMTVESQNWLLVDSMIADLIECATILVDKISPKIDIYLNELFNPKKHAGERIKLNFSDDYP